MQVCVYVHVCMCVCAHVSVCMHVCVCACCSFTNSSPSHPGEGESGCVVLCGAPAHASPGQDE